ncbi:SMC-Scp complex subunit ScpB [Sphingomonas sp. LR61]|uniref:SMC-Scp complex subunit ScpB n=1 Tax=Sphingomonas sp. LR61 TaxID=3050234 RepID=UPI002FE1201A
MHDTSSAEPGGADEMADARAIEHEIHARAEHAEHEHEHDHAPQAHPAIPIDRQLEAILMIADEPQSLVALGAAVNAPVPAVRQAVERLVADFDGVDGTTRRGFELREVGGGWRFYVRQDLDAVVEQFVEAERPSRLSQAALETLAVVAYKQPITRSQIASIRAVNVDGVVRDAGRARSHRGVVHRLRDRRHQLRHVRSAPAAARHQLARRAAAHLAPPGRRCGRLRAERRDPRWPGLTTGGAARPRPRRPQRTLRRPGSPRAFGSRPRRGRLQCRWPLRRVRSRRPRGRTSAA